MVVAEGVLKVAVVQTSVPTHASASPQAATVQLTLVHTLYNPENT